MPSAPSPAEAQADAAARAGRPVDARRLLEQAAGETPSRRETWMKLASMCRAMGDHQAGLAAISRALALDPLDFSALLAKATLLEKLGEDLAAGEVYGHALAQRPPVGSEPPALKTIIAHAEERYRSFQAAQLSAMGSGIPDDPELSGEERGKLERFCTNIARTTQPYTQQPSHFHYPGTPALEFHDRSHFPWLNGLEAAAPDIRAEFDAVLAAEASSLVPYIQYPDDVPLRQWEALNRSSDWSAIHLLQNGRTIGRNARHCPATMAMLSSFPQPDVPGRSPNAMFSLLAPGTRIPPHTGVSNTRLVCHLPLIVPPSCGFRVGAETRHWEVGKAWVFDDTIEHEAWNESAELRVVFIFDVWTPSLSEAERRAITAITATADPAAEGQL